MQGLGFRAPTCSLHCSSLYKVTRTGTTAESMVVGFGLGFRGRALEVQRGFGDLGRV